MFLVGISTIPKKETQNNEFNYLTVSHFQKTSRLFVLAL